jgi:superfamily II DNA helicase RecQ
MEIQLRIYNVPVSGPEREERMGEVNAFVKGRDIRKCTAQVIESGPQPYWTLMIAYSTEAGVQGGSDCRPKEESDISRYQGGSADADPNDLDAAEKRVFNDLRRWRRSVADKENKPLYLILNNRQLIDIIKSEPRTPKDLMNIKSIPEKKARDYGSQIIKILWAER